MHQLNYHHLYYFYVTAREGSIAKASEILHLTPQTVSSQIATLESYFNAKLFERTGKSLLVNGTGKHVYSYAEDIFGLGSELVNSLKQRSSIQHKQFNVGITNIVPKILSFDLFKTCFDYSKDLKLICKEGDLNSLLADMAINKIDIIFSDRPLPPETRVKAYNHFVGETGMSFFTSAERAERITKDFPKSLDGVPMILPGEKSTQHIELLAWFERENIQPDIVAEFEDSALMKLFGQSGIGVFCSPTPSAKHVMQQYQVVEVGRSDAIREDYYLISPERKLKHPASMHLFEEAKAIICG